MFGMKIEPDKVIITHQGHKIELSKMDITAILAAMNAPEWEQEKNDGDKNKV